MVETLVHPTAPTDHTMGAHLSRYVLPKVPVFDLTDIQGVKVYGSRSLAMLLDAKPDAPKRFNWRRPDFVRTGRYIHCVTSPGQDYTHHYAKLIATANMIRGREVPVLLDRPNDFQVDAFIERWLPKTIPSADVVILGYVQHLFKDIAGDEEWSTCHGFGWKRIPVVGRAALLLGCEFSYWGDIAGALVASITRRGLAPWIVYVGKLGALDPHIAPNEWLATGSRSTLRDIEIEWRSRLSIMDAESRLIQNVSHVTMGSVVDETKAWAAQASQLHQVVDPEIGHMGLKAGLGGVDFDFLHLITDNLLVDSSQGLYDERSAEIKRARMKLLQTAGEILMNAIIQTC